MPLLTTIYIAKAIFLLLLLLLTTTTTFTTLIKDPDTSLAGRWTTSAHILVVHWLQLT